jgi:hypothetical protein
MSNERMFDTPLALEALALGAPGSTPAAEAEASPDAARIRAAFERIDSAIRGEHDHLGRLRGELGAMAIAIAQAMRASETGGNTIDLNTLLRDLERRVDGMIAFVGAVTVSSATETAAAEPLPAATEPPAPSPEELAFLEALSASTDETSVPAAAAPEQDRVPTVSDVVSRLGRAGDAPIADAGDGDATKSGSAVTTVAMLEAMVEALAASVPDGPPPEPAASLPELEQSDEPPQAEASASLPPAQPTATEPATRVLMMPEVELLSNYARMVSVPFLPPEVGTAVIFTAKALPEPPSPIQSETEPGSHAVAGPIAEAAPHPVAAPEVGAVEAAQSPQPQIDLDTDDFLFGPQAEPEADPAGFLLEATPDPAPPPEALPPQSEPTMQPEPADFLLQPAPAIEWPMPSPIAALPIALPAPAPPQVSSLPKPAAPNDPLAPLKAMSEEEKIALFS